MRADERAAEAINDAADPRGLLLSATERELAPLRALTGAETAERIAQSIAERISGELPRETARKPALLRLAVWAASELGGRANPRDLAEADRALLALAKHHESVENATAEGNRRSALPPLVEIALRLAELRRRKTDRLSWWKPLLNRLAGRGTEPPPPPRDIRGTGASASGDRAAKERADDILWETIRGAAGRLPLSTWEEKLKEARKDIGRFNIIVAGRTGVGKTTLIGAIFGEEVGDTLMGRPRTRGRIWYPLMPGEADVLRLCDTEGLEMERYQETLDGLKREIESRNASSDPFDHIHVAWLCIDEPSLTVQPGEEALVETLTREGVPVIVVLTKAGMAPAFERTVAGLLPKARAVVRVRAAPIEIEGQIFAPMGLDGLLAVTEAAIPDAVEAAWHVASRNLEAMTRRAETIVRRSAAAAGAAGAAPIPLADAAGVFGVQVGMIIAVSLNMGVKLKRADLQAMAVTLISALGLTAGGRFIAGQFAKLIPGLGTVAGSAITGTTAAALTYGLGRAYLEYLRRFFEQNRRMPNADELVSGFRGFWRRWKNKEEPPPGTPNS